MDKKAYLLIGLTGCISFTLATFSFQYQSVVQGALLIVVMLTTAIVLSLLEVKGGKKDTPQSVLEDVLSQFQLFTLLFNAVCIFINDDSIWEVSIFESIFFPIIMLAFVSKIQKLKVYEHVAISFAIVITANYIFSQENNEKLWMAAASYFICYVMPSIISLKKLK